MRALLTATALSLALAAPLSAGVMAPASTETVAGDGSSAQVLPAQRAAGSGYHYGATYTQILEEPSRGVRATFTVHRPGQVKGRKGQHSIGQIAVGNTGTREFVEAGWRQYRDGPRLFVFWRPADGSGTCYDFGCGFKDRGPGIRPHSKLKAGSTITIGFKYSHRKWWLIVNGRKSGFYPARLWDGTFTSSDYSSVFGEVYVKPSQRLCADMGNGKRAKQKSSANVTNVAFYDGPPVVLTRADSSDLKNYSVRVAGDNSFRYGGPGAC